MKFIRDLIVAGSGTSSKRFISIMSFVLLVIVVISDIWFDKDVNDVVYYTLGGIILGASSLTLAQRGHYPRYDNGEYNNDLPNNELQ